MATVIVGVPGETAPDESRVALTPQAASRLVEHGLEVHVAAGAGEAADRDDEAYTAAGCAVAGDAGTVLDRADVVLRVRALAATPAADLEAYRDGHLLVALVAPTEVTVGDLEALADRGVSVIALERVPRTGRAQSMDVLSSMASVAGYKAAVLAADTLPALFPLQMTAAGTVRPARVFVVGAGVAGLQAIATAKRLGARVRAFDIRPAVREEVESLGAEFVELDLEVEDAAAATGYAREQSESVLERQRELMTRVVRESDVVITAAAVPGRRAPTLVTAGMVEGMARGAVVVDLAADGGGNCEPTRPGEAVEHAGVTVLGPTNLPGAVSHTASQLFATNVANLVESLLVDGELVIDTADEVVDETLVVHDGAIRHPPTGSGGAG